MILSMADIARADTLLPLVIGLAIVVYQIVKAAKSGRTVTPGQTDAEEREILLSPEEALGELLKNLRRGEGREASPPPLPPPKEPPPIPVTRHPEPPPLQPPGERETLPAETWQVRQKALQKRKEAHRQAEQAHAGPVHRKDIPSAPSPVSAVSVNETAQSAASRKREDLYRALCGKPHGAVSLRKAIVWSEILGPPMALRRHPPAHR